MTESRIGWRVNEALLIVIIIFQVLDFFKLLDPFWDYVKKIISWTLIGYLVYQLSPSKLFFGERHKWWDASLIISFFAFMLKDLLGFAQVARDKMLTHILDFTTFIPHAVNKSAIPLLLGEGAFNSFKYLGFLPNASTLALPFATKLTMSNSAVPFLFKAGNQSAGALLQPYGLNGALFQFYNSLSSNTAIESAGFLAALLFTLLLALLASNFRVKEPSILSLAGKRWLLWFVELAFYLAFFNLVAEWLAIAIDAPLLMTGLVLYIFIAFRVQRGGFSESELLQRIVNFGTSFLKEVARLFTRRDTILLGLSGLLVLHLLTDIGVFLIPYITGLKDPLYFGRLGPGHDSILKLLMGRPPLIIGAYILGTVGLFMLLALPAYIWYKSFQLRTRPEGVPESAFHPNLPSWLIGLGLASMASLVLSPPFAIHRVASEAIIGVDLQTRALSSALGLMVAPFIFLLVLLTAVLAPKMKRWFMALLFGGSILFFIIYIYEYFMASTAYFLTRGLSFIGSGSFTYLIIGATFLLFYLISMLFYMFGMIGFIYETVRDD